MPTINYVIIYIIEFRKIMTYLKDLALRINCIIFVFENVYATVHKITTDNLNVLNWVFDKYWITKCTVLNI